MCDSSAEVTYGMAPPQVRHISLRHLRLVSVLGRELNISRSAGVLHTTQPALSRSLAELEDWLDTRLFNRTTKRITPTAAGLAILLHANRILAEIDSMREELAEIRDGARGSLRIGVVPAISTRLLGSGIARLRQMLPQVSVSVTTLGLGALYEALLGGQVDVMLAPAELNVDLKLVKVEDVYVESTRVLATPRHPLASQAAVSESDVASFPWVLPPTEMPVRPRLNKMLALHRADGAPSASDVEADSFSLAVELVARSDMLCVLPTRVAEHLGKQAGLTEISLQPPLLTGPMCALRLRDAPVNIGMDALIRCLRDSAGESN
jgi:LysR family transcriptional regulator, pca operon transcriptional activator